MAGFTGMVMGVATYPHLTPGPKATARGVGSAALMMGVDTVTCTKVLRWAQLIPTLLGVADLPYHDRVYTGSGTGAGAGFGYGAAHGDGEGYGPDIWDFFGDGTDYGNGNGRGGGSGYGTFDGNN